MEQSPELVNRGSTPSSHNERPAHSFTPVAAQHPSNNGGPTFQPVRPDAQSLAAGFLDQETNVAASSASQPLSSSAPVSPRATTSSPSRQNPSPLTLNPQSRIPHRDPDGSIPSPSPSNIPHARPSPGYPIPSPTSSWLSSGQSALQRLDKHEIIEALSLQPSGELAELEAKLGVLLERAKQEAAAVYCPILRLNREILQRIWRHGSGRLMLGLMVCKTLRACLFSIPAIALRTLPEVEDIDASSVLRLLTGFRKTAVAVDCYDLASADAMAGFVDGLARAVTAKFSGLVELKFTVPPHLRMVRQMLELLPTFECLRSLSLRRKLGAGVVVPVPCLFVNALVQALQGCPKLEHLAIENIDIGGDKFSKICDSFKGCSVLQSLELNYCCLGNTELSQLTGLLLEEDRIQQLRHLRFSRSNISSHGLQELRNLLHQTTSLTSLNLSENSALDSPIESSLLSLAEILGHCPLRSLDLEGTHLNIPYTPFDTCAVIEKIRTLTGLTYLNLSCGLLTQVEHGIGLAEGLNCCSSLTDLRLSACFGQHFLVTESRISERLADSLSGLPLSRLDVDNNRFGDDGIAIILSALQGCSSLSRLAIGNTGLTASGAVVLGSSLSAIGRLTTLCLRDNNLGLVGAGRVARSLIHCTSLKQLSCKGMGLDRSAEILLQELLKDVQLQVN